MTLTLPTEFFVLGELNVQEAKRRGS